MRSAFISGHRRPIFSRRDRVGNSGRAARSRRAHRRKLAPLELPNHWIIVARWAAKAPA